MRICRMWRHQRLASCRRYLGRRRRDAATQHCGALILLFAFASAEEANEAIRRLVGERVLERACLLARRGRRHSEDLFEEAGQEAMARQDAARAS